MLKCSIHHTRQLARPAHWRASATETTLLLPCMLLFARRHSTYDVLKLNVIYSTIYVGRFCCFCSSSLPLCVGVFKYWIQASYYLHSTYAIHTAKRKQLTVLFLPLWHDCSRRSATTDDIPLAGYSRWQRQAIWAWVYVGTATERRHFTTSINKYYMHFRLLLESFQVHTSYGIAHHDRSTEFSVRTLRVHCTILMVLILPVARRLAHINNANM